MAAPPVQAVSPLLTTTQMNPTLFDPLENARIKALYDSRMNANKGNGSNRDNDYSGGNGFGASSSSGSLSSGQTDYGLY